jgi:glucosamine kinase
VIVVAGTGSVGEVLRSDGSRLAVGGWGFPVGDEGSGAWLGLHAMRLAHQSIDARVPAGPLARAVFALAGETRERLLAWCEHAGQHEYAQLAPLVFEAEASDNAAKHLLDVAARALEALAVALDPQGQLPLAVVGSIAVRLAARFSPSMRNRCVAAQGDAAEGALHLIRAALQGAAQ